MTPKIFKQKEKERKTCVLLGLIILKLFWITVYIAAYSVHTKRAIVYHSIIYLGGGGWYLCQQLIFHCSNDNNKSGISLISTNEKARLCLSKHKSKRRPSDQKFSQQQTESDRIKDELTVLV